MFSAERGESQGKTWLKMRILGGRGAYRELAAFREKNGGDLRCGRPARYDWSWSAEPRQDRRLKKRGRKSYISGRVRINNAPFFFPEPPSTGQSPSASSVLSAPQLIPEASHLWPSVIQPFSNRN
ncbi:hypothetical protein CPC08DRAFT_214270 [Agrocybe pediades]|nr:hypothetical protein CPC08DRAFT_214270 [Agrocybe pediades]